MRFGTSSGITPERNGWRKGLLASATLLGAAHALPARAETLDEPPQPAFNEDLAGWSLASLAKSDQPPPPEPPEAEPLAPEPAYTLTPSGHVPAEFAAKRGFFQQAGTIKTELIVVTGYFAVQSVPKFFKETSGFSFHDEGWFGTGTGNAGVDKLTHAYNSYLLAEILHARLHKNTGASAGDAVTAAILSAGFMALNEVSDAFEPDSGYSMQDITANIVGASFSVVRNTVPGLKEKLAFKVEIVPNDDIYTRAGKKHYEQQRYMLSLKGAGFRQLEHSPFRFLDLQVGYYASDFRNSDRAQGIVPKRHLFVGVGLNLGEILFANSHSTIGKAAHSVLDYVQIPYTSLRYDTTGRFGS